MPRPFYHRCVAVMMSLFLCLQPVGPSWAQMTRTTQKTQLPLASAAGYQSAAIVEQARASSPPVLPWTKIEVTKNLRLLAVSDGLIFSVSSHNRLLVRTGSGTARRWKDIGDAANSIGIAGTRHKLFATTADNKLLVRDASSSTQSWKIVGSAGNTVAITAARGYLFGVTTNNELVAREAVPAQREWKNLGPAQQVRVVTSNGGRLLGVTEEGMLVTRDAILGSASWSNVGNALNVRALLAAQGGLFALLNDGTLKFQPFAGTRVVSADGLPGVYVRDLPVWLQTRFTPRHTDRRGTGSYGPVLPTEEHLKRTLTAYQQLKRTAAAKEFSAKTVKRLQQALAAGEAKKPVAKPVQSPVTTVNDEVLRVLIFDGTLDLRQTLTHEGLAYPLDNPSIRISPPSQYNGYVLVADEIVLNENIVTKGNDLILIAKRISVPGSVASVSLDTRPLALPTALDEQNGGDADNGGDVMFVAKQLAFGRKVTVITTGGKGQDGGNGRAITQPTDVFQGDQATSVVDAFAYGKFVVNGTLSGTVINFQPEDSFYAVYGAYNCCCWLTWGGGPTPPRGQYGILGGLKNAANLTTARIDIPQGAYPTSGGSGGYGGLPGKTSVISPDTSASGSITTSAESGIDGSAGAGGRAGEVLPMSVQTAEPAPIFVRDYVAKYSRDNLKSSGLDDAGRRNIQSMPDNKDFVVALIGFLTTGGLRIQYFSSLDAKLSNQDSRLSESWPAQPMVSAAFFSAQCVGGSYFDIQFNNIVPYDPTLGATYWPSTLRMMVAGGRQGEALPVLPPVSESVLAIEDNWYNAVYKLVPEFPEHLAQRADKIYREGNFGGAFPDYQDVIAFSGNSGFRSDDLVSDASYRIGIGSLGLDYFSFRPDMNIPVSPSQELDLIARYSGAVRYFNESIRAALAAQAQNQNLALLLEEFVRQHDNVTASLEDSITEVKVQLAAANLDMDAMRHEIDATLRANIRLGGLLQSWETHVTDEIERYKAEHPEPTVWEEALSNVWGGIQIEAAIIGTAISLGTAVGKVGDAWSKLDEYSVNSDALFDTISDGEAIMGTMTSDDAKVLTNELLSGYAKLKESSDHFMSALSGATDAVKTVVEKARDLKNKLETLTSTTEAWTDSEAINWRDNVLRAEEIGVTGGMTYLQIREQIAFNTDLLLSKNLALAAAQTRALGLATQASSMTKELLRHAVDRQYLADIIDALDQENASTASVTRQLNQIGQGELDAMMRRLQESAFELKFLELDDSLAQGRYDRFIEKPVDVGLVLDGELQLNQRVSDWTAKSANIGRVKVLVSTTDQHQIGTLATVAPFALKLFSTGDFVRPSHVAEIEPLRETSLVGNIAAALRERLADPTQLAQLLAAQFSLAVDSSIKATIDRERQYHSILLDPAIALSDLEVLLAYGLAAGGVLPEVLANVTAQAPAGDPLKSSLQKLQQIWPMLSAEIMSEDVTSLRNVAHRLMTERANPSNTTDILNAAFISAGQPAALRRFHVNHDDIQQEIAASFDKDFPDYQVLGSIGGSDDLNVVLAVALLYGNFSSAELQALSTHYGAENAVGARLAVLLPEWERLRRSVLERQHSLKLNVDRDGLMGLTNMSGTYQHRFLAGSINLRSPSGSLGTGTVLTKLPEDYYERKDGGPFQIAYPNGDQLLYSDPLTLPPSFVLSDYHYGSLFGRSIVGSWELSINVKGDSPVFPELQQVEVEFVYSYQK